MLVVALGDCSFVLAFWDVGVWLLLFHADCTGRCFVGERTKYHASAVENAVNRRCFTRHLTLSKSIC